MATYLATFAFLFLGSGSNSPLDCYSLKDSVISDTSLSLIIPLTTKISGLAHFVREKAQSTPRPDFAKKGKMLDAPSTDLHKIAPTPFFK